MADDDSLTLRIEDEDGFATEWEWPKDRTLLGHGDFVGLFEAQHDAAREAALFTRSHP